MKKKQTKKAVTKAKADVKVVNQDIAKTIQATYQQELKTQTQSIQTLKKSLKSLAMQLKKAVSARRVLKKKKIQIAKKAGLTPQGMLKKQLMQARAEYETMVDEVKKLQVSMEQTRQAIRMAKEELRKVAAIIRTIKKMEKQWSKAIAAKFRAKRVVKKKTKSSVKRKKREQVVVEEVQPEVIDVPVAA